MDDTQPAPAGCRRRLTDTDDAERAEVLAVACADSDAALECFRALVADRTR